MKEEHLKTMLKEWNKLKEDLTNGNTNDLRFEEILNTYTFSKNFSQIIEATGNLFELESNEIGPVYRARGFEVKLNEPDKMLTTVKWAKKHNRMNKPGQAFNYFGILPINKGPKEEIAKTLILDTLKAEIRAQNGQTITVSRFKLDENLKIFNMYPNEELPKDFFTFFEILDAKINSFKGSDVVKKKKIKSYINEMFAKYFFNLFNSEEIFKPVNFQEEEERAKEYAPFQFLTSYIESLGYDGMKYKSTVNKNGANLVIFDPDKTKVMIETMEYVEIK